MMVVDFLCLIATFFLFFFFVLLMFFFFFFNDTATTEIYTLSLHDALPISRLRALGVRPGRRQVLDPAASDDRDRKSTRLNSSHSQISYAVFCLKKKKKKIIHSICLLQISHQYI